MKILLYGDTEPGSGAWCYAQTLRTMGHVVLEQSDQACLEAYRRNVALRISRRLLGAPLPWHRRRHGQLLVAKVAQDRPELVIVLKGLHVSLEDVQSMQRTGASVVIINHDDFFSRNRTNWSRVQREAIPYYDYVFTTREVNVAEVKSWNSRVEFLGFAYHPDIHRVVEIPEAEREKWESDVVFVGTFERERAKLLEQLVQRVPARYSIWGGQWERVRRSSPLAPFVKRRPVYMEEMAKAISGSKIALAFLRKANRDEYTQRTFEIPACGGLLLAERTQQHLAYFREGVEAEFFDPRDVNELATKVADLLRDAERRARIRDAGMRALGRQSHTYRDRVERVLQVVRQNRIQRGSRDQR